MSDRPDDDEEYKRIFGLMRKHYRTAFRVFIISTNTEAYNDETKTASECFVSFDVLEDAMPFLTEPWIEVDIRWTWYDLQLKVKEMGLEKGQTVVLTNQSQLEVIPQDSAVLGRRREPCAISSLLDPTRVVMDTTMSNVQEVGDQNFLFRCSSLKKVDLKGLHSVQKVGYSFLYDCPSLEEVDFSDLTNVQEVVQAVLYRCPSLTKVILPVSPPDCLRRAVEALPAAVLRTVN